jgi:hypothetical protein
VLSRAGFAGAALTWLPLRKTTAAELADDELLDRAATLGRVLFSNDEDLLVEAATRQRTATPFAGLIYAHELNVTIRQCIDDMELICAVYQPSEFEGRVEHIPLK